MTTATDLATTPTAPVHWRTIDVPSPREDDWCPPPGIYTGTPREEYLDWRAISNSSLAMAMRSMQHYRMQRPVEESDQMRFGTLCHAGKFEPLEIPKRYIVMPDWTRDRVFLTADGKPASSPRATKEYKSLVSEFQLANVGKIVVEEGEYRRMLDIVYALESHPKANEYLNGGICEVALVWRDAATGLLCKGLVDVWQPHRRITDFKTTADASSPYFERQIANRGYHRQLPFYNSGFRAHGYMHHEMCIVAVETVPPVYGIRAKPLPIEAVEVGEGIVRELLDQIAECMKTNVWPGYECEGEWELPKWAVPDEELEIHE